MTNAIVMGGSKGIGKAIAVGLREIGCNVIATSRKDIDTSDLSSVEKFTKEHPSIDILILNTGGPPAKEFADVTIQEWNKYHNQLFLGFCMILKNIKINDDGYIFLISSSVIKEPNPRLVLSSTYRLAFTSVFQILSKDYAKRNINCINIAPGLIDTDRTRELLSDIFEYEKTLPMGRMGKPEEIGNFVKNIVKDEIKYLSGTVVNFDGADSALTF